jgi:hypothetical protein
MYKGECWWRSSGKWWKRQANRFTRMFWKAKLRGKRHGVEPKASKAHKECDWKGW